MLFCQSVFEAVTNLLTPTLKRCPHLGVRLNGIRLSTPGIVHAMAQGFEKNGDFDR